MKRVSGVVARRQLASYAAPAFVLSLPVIPVYIYLPALYGVELGLGLALTGTLLLVSRLFDAVTDPLVGYLADRTPVFGYWWKVWIVIGGVCAGIGLIQILDPPDAPSATYLVGWLLILYLGWTIISVPYNAWGARLSDDYHQRVRITATRESFGLAGILAASVLIGLLGVAGQEMRSAVSYIALFAIFAGIPAFFLLLKFVPEPDLGDRINRLSANGLGARITQLWRNRLFVRLLLAWFINGLANGIPAALFFIYLEFGLGVSEKLRPQFVLLYFLCAVLSIPVWTAVSKRAGKHRTWCIAMAVAIITFAFVPFIPVGGYFCFAAVCILTGMALGADLALPPSIQADVVDYHQLKFGVLDASFQFAAWGLSTKLALAFAVGLALSLVDYAGFDPEVPTAEGIYWLSVIYALLPAVIKIFAVILMWRFPLTRANHQIILKRVYKEGMP